MAKSAFVTAFESSAAADLAAFADGIVDYRPHGGAEKTIAAAWEYGDLSPEEVEGGSEYAEVARLWILTDSTDGVADPRHPDKLVVSDRDAAGETWVVLERSSHGGGMAELVIGRQEGGDHWAAPPREESRR